MSSYKYTLDDADLAIHLTNNAVQKKDKDYGKHEDGNILSFAQATEATGVDFAQYAITDILPVIELSLIAARNKINKQNRRFCFEILGYDFMIDNQLKPWLIEVNTNPALEESNGLLKQIVPRMLDDAFKLTVDVIYPPIKSITRKLTQEPDDITA